MIGTIDKNTRLQEAELKNTFLMREVERLRERVGDLTDIAVRYNVLRKLEVIIMSPEGPRYLREDELDEYINTLADNRIGVYAQEVAQAIRQGAVR